MADPLEQMRQIVGREQIMEIIREAPETAGIVVLIQPDVVQPFAQTMLFNGPGMCLERAVWMMKRVARFYSRM